MHICVLFDKQDHFDFLIRELSRKDLQLLKTKNSSGYTPLFLAALLAMTDMFKKIESALSVEYWSYGGAVTY